MSFDAFIPFARPDVGEPEAAAVAAAIMSGWVTSGPVMKQFEEDFAAYLGGDVETVAVNSATAGLHLALEAIGVGPGDEVIVPTWTFTSTAEVVRYLGATPVIVDVDRETLNISLDAIEAALTDRTKAIMPVHFAGLPVDLVGVREIVSGRDVHIVEDAAHALPALGSSGLVGNCGSSDAAVFSFYATKTMTTGEGGMIATRDPRIASRARVMRLHGIDRDAFDRYVSVKPAWAYDVVAPGFKYNMPDIAAAMGRVQLKRADEMHARRSAIAEFYSSELKDTAVETPAAAPPGGMHSWHLFIIRLPVGLDRDGFIESMAAAGVGTSVHFIPLHEHTYWRPFAPDPSRTLPVASSEASRVVSLPISSGLSDDEIARVAEVTKACVA